MFRNSYIKIINRYKQVDLSEYNKKCWIWGTPAKVIPNPKLDTNIVDSPKAGGQYEINASLQNFNISRLTTLKDQISLTTCLVNSRNSGNDCPMVKPEMLEEARGMHSANYNERMLKMLEYREPLLTPNIVESGLWPSKQGEE